MTTRPLAPWPRADLLSAAELIVAVIGLLIILLGVIPSILPEVVAVYKLSSDQLQGLSTVTTEFENKGYKLPVSEIYALWQLDRTGVLVGLDPGAPRSIIRATPSDSEVTLTTLEPLRPRSRFRTVFSAAHPFIVKSLAGRARITLIDAAGTSYINAPLISARDYDEIYRSRTFTAAMIVVLYMVGVLALMILIPKMLRR